jgi:chromosome segregation ATPase
VEQVSIDQILAYTYIKNQEKEGKAIKQMLEIHKQEMSEMRKAMDALGPKFNQLSEMVSEMIKDYSQIKQVIRECEVRYGELENKLRHEDEGQRKNNVIIFGLQKKREENYIETLDTVVKWLHESMKAETTIKNIDHVARLGSRRVEHPILIKFTSF